GTIDNTAGVISFTANTLLGTVPGVGDSGTLAVLAVDGLSPGTSSIDLSNVLLLDSNLNPINFDLQAGSITVAPVTATPEPSSITLLFAAAGVLIFLRRR
ncbi:MAG TPA: PEP-CTERM sorting domain-containing protein, partial [Candidatus Acidoferrum sp.]